MFCAPDSWDTTPAEESKREGRDGKWHVEPISSSLVLFPAAKKDYWRLTYYEPLLVKDDGCLLYATLLRTEYYTIETCFMLYAVCQFDQAGLMIRLDREHWIKTGIEVVDHTARLSCVVTNVYSDWSTQPWPSEKTTIDSGTNESWANKSFQKVDCSIRVHCRGTSIVVEAQYGTRKSEDTDLSSETWEFIRIANLSDTIVATSQDPAASTTSPIDSTAARNKMQQGPTSDSMWAGVFGCCPEDQQGGHVKFTSFRIQKGSIFDHNAQGNLDELAPRQHE